MLSTILGCGGNAQAERLVVENIRLLNEQSAAFEEIGKNPDAAKARDIQDRITKIRAEIAANNKPWKTFSPIAQLKEIGDRHKAELDQATERLRKSVQAVSGQNAEPEEEPVAVTCLVLHPRFAWPCDPALTHDWLLVVRSFTSCAEGQSPA